MGVNSTLTECGAKGLVCRRGCCPNLDGVTGYRLAQLVARYGAALAVAFVVSLASVHLVFPLGVGPGSIVVGFIGVLVGSLCLPSRNRFLGSLVLTVVGSAFYLDRWSRLQWEMGRLGASELSFPMMPGLLVGGMLATGVIAGWRRVVAPSLPSSIGAGVPPTLDELGANDKNPP